MYLTCTCMCALTLPAGTNSTNTTVGCPDTCAILSAPYLHLCDLDLLPAGTNSTNTTVGCPDVNVTLAQHNTYRAVHSAANLTWNPSLASGAQVCVRALCCVRVCVPACVYVRFGGLVACVPACLVFTWIRACACSCVSICMCIRVLCCVCAVDVWPYARSWASVWIR